MLAVLAIHDGDKSDRDESRRGPLILPEFPLLDAKPQPLLHPRTPAPSQALTRCHSRAGEVQQNNSRMEALHRFEEAAALTRDRLSHFRSDVARDAVASGGLPAQEALSSLCWASCVLLSSAEEALQTKQAKVAADNQRASDQLERAQLSCTQSLRDLESVAAERDALRQEVQHLAGRVRKDGLTTRQRQAKDAARIQGLSEQLNQLQASLRLSESAWAEERRAEQAAGAQRERNFQSVIVRLQHELEAVTPAAPAAAATAHTPAGAAGMLAAPPHAGTGGSAAATAAAEEAAAMAAAGVRAEELVAARGRIVELQAQCDRGVSLIERLKLRLESQEKGREAQMRKESELQASLRVAQQQAAQAQRQEREGGASAASDERALRTRHASEIKSLTVKMEALEAEAAQHAAQAEEASRKLRALDQRASEAEKAQSEAEARAGSAIEDAEAAAQKASNGREQLLKAALCESQRRLQATQKALDAAVAELTWRRPTSGAYTAAATVDVSEPGDHNTMSHRAASPRSVSNAIDSAVTALPPQATPAPTGSNGSVGAEPPSTGQRPGIGRLRGQLLDSLRAERSKLERERTLLEHR